MKKLPGNSGTKYKIKENLNIKHGLYFSIHKEKDKISELKFFRKNGHLLFSKVF